MRDALLSFVLRSAWPNRSIDSLLRAVALNDETAAAAAWRDFEAAADFDHLTAGEMRLIGLASKRLARLAPESPMLMRIGGIERANWSRSQLAVSAAGEGLRALAACSIEMLVIKGASRAARGDLAARGRMVNDIDIVVRPGDMTRAFDILTRDEWQPAGSGTVVFHRSRLAGAIGINLVRGRFGNLDLHRTPFHQPYEGRGDGSRADDASIWSRASAGILGYVPVLVPSATDAVAIAIAHGALDAHKSSDWLADIVAAVDSGVDWDLLEALIDGRRLHGPAAVALGYVDGRLERPIPAPLLAQFERTAVRRPLAFLAALAETRPKTSHIGLFWIARALAKQRRLWRGRPSALRSRIILPSPAARTRQADAAPSVLSQAFSVPGRQQGQPWNGKIDLTISVDLPPASRRIDLEINSPDRHIARLRAVVLNRGKREKTLRFKVPLVLGPQDSSLVLAAAPSRSFNDGAPQRMIDRYGPTPFRLIHCESKRSGKVIRETTPGELGTV